MGNKYVDDETIKLLDDRIAELKKAEYSQENQSRIHKLIRIKQELKNDENQNKTKIVQITEKNENRIHIQTTFAEFMSSGENDKERQELKKKMRIAIERGLTDYQRKVLNMNYFQGMTQMEIGKELGVSQQIISKTLKRARKNIRRYTEMIDQNNGDLPDYFKNKYSSKNTL